MPPFAGALTGEQIDAVANYVAAQLFIRTSP
jgi:mono/diheme cytochrome c family protein